MKAILLAAALMILPGAGVGQDVTLSKDQFEDLTMKLARQCDATASAALFSRAAKAAGVSAEQIVGRAMIDFMDTEMEALDMDRQDNRRTTPSAILFIGTIGRSFDAKPTAGIMIERARCYRDLRTLIEAAAP